MSDKLITYYENNYDPLNRAIDESIKTQRSRTAWRYAKVISLSMMKWSYRIHTLNGESCNSWFTYDSLHNSPSMLYYYP